MYVSLTRATVPDQPLENATIVAQEMVRWLRDIEGFEGFVMLSKPGTSIGMSFWDSRETAEEHLPSRKQFIERMTSAAGVHVEEMTGYEVMFADVGELMVNAPE